MEESKWNCWSVKLPSEGEEGLNPPWLLLLYTQALPAFYQLSFRFCFGVFLLSSSVSLPSSGIDSSFPNQLCKPDLGRGPYLVAFNSHDPLTLHGRLCLMTEVDQNTNNCFWMACPWGCVSGGQCLLQSLPQHFRTNVMWHVFKQSWPDIIRIPDHDPKVEVDS